MKINPKYGDKIISIPGTQVLEHLKEASEAELKVLIYALANQSITYKEAENAIGLSTEEIRNALTVWKDKGVMSVTELSKKNVKKEAEQTASETDEEKQLSEKGIEKEQKKSGVILMSSELPAYSSDQINRILEKNRGTKTLIDNCQQILGKIMSVHEVEVIMKLIDYLGLDHDYVLLLCTHCANINKTSLRYIEKTAVTLFDSGITEYIHLEKYIETFNFAKSREGKIRKLLGLGDRSLTKKEREAFYKWASWDMPMDVIEKAFEITAENTKRFSLNYMNTILERWFKEGLVTLDAVERSLSEYKSNHDAKNTKSAAKGSSDGGSFVTEDFFEDALKRSYSTSDSTSS